MTRQRAQTWSWPPTCTFSLATNCRWPVMSRPLWQPRKGRSWWRNRLAGPCRSRAAHGDAEGTDRDGGRPGPRQAGQHQGQTHQPTPGPPACSTGSTNHRASPSAWPEREPGTRRPQWRARAGDYSQRRAPGQEQLTAGERRARDSERLEVLDHRQAFLLGEVVAERVAAVAATGQTGVIHLAALEG